jgi:hypothetical protein
MKCRYSQKYRPIYQTYTNGTNTSGYGADVFEKNCKGKMYNFNTLKETTDNHHITLGRPALISCKDGDTKKGKIYCPSVDSFISQEQCSMYKPCDCTKSEDCEKCVKKKCLKNHKCDALCNSRAGGLHAWPGGVYKQTLCETCKLNK